MFGNQDDCAGYGGSAELECVSVMVLAQVMSVDGAEVCDSSECSDTPANYPSWSVNINVFQNSGSVTSIVMIDDVMVGTY